ncbi:glutaminyl-peptide cyclotransferase [Nocardia brasiliensis]|uniref:Glutamine cyclotransferase n=1 Tax=Nocardia brasiliensis (strain ATCC 700358 / HUJEG-1) TaxID=1133849 RepID=K0ESM3_NOCB7|nr:glutaminyl-peptide cyclotransferase [Nocardia brasiliensis]AFT98685.1 glutamine cyclotransferase [Nocardia brasiliensis ATCC 700358]OCF88965.1 glutaminyl-peptide cyclotransferase [Nocardia brasiliensis]
MKRNRRSLAVGLLVGLVIFSGCGAAQEATPELKIEVVAVRPHDPTAFTQGLEIDGNVLYEGTGLSGASSVRATDVHTGEQLARTDLPAPFFGEGLTVAGDTLWQLTWQEHTAFARDPVTLAERARVPYEGEGWGLCTRNGRLVMSDGTDTLTFRDPVTFAPTDSIRLTSHQSARLNELDCAEDGSVYANDWPTDTILRLDPDSGEVLARIDASALYPAAARVLTGSDALNGIAQLPGTDRFLLAGKKWPSMFEVRFVPA